MLAHKSEIEKHRLITKAVHENGSKICLQILHAGRYAFHPFAVAPSRLKAPISRFTPWTLSERGIRKTISSYGRCAKLAMESGYDGVEIMGSEGYLINQFLSPSTNLRTDQWGGSSENRQRLAQEIVREVRNATHPDFIIIFRLSMLDLIKHGQSWGEIVELARALESNGVNAINTGIGWHEARIPTIAMMVPRGAFAWVTSRMKSEVNIPLIATNRINDPHVAEDILADGKADMVSMARPFLADPFFMAKAKEGRSEEINTCIACNQSCLDQIFNRKTASCMVNPRACRETEIQLLPTQNSLHIGVVGAGPAGMSAALTAAQCGHRVTLFEKSGEIGGLLRLASRVHGKEEFLETIRYFNVMLAKHGVKIMTNTTIDPANAHLWHVDRWILSSGVKPRLPEIKGLPHPLAVSYEDVLSGRVDPGRRIAIIGSGGIAIDVARFLMPFERSFDETWGIDRSLEQPGGLKTTSVDTYPGRHIYMLARSEGKPGARLGKTTAWIHRLELRKSGVQYFDGCDFLEIGDGGILFRKGGEIVQLPVDQVILCTGQQSVNPWASSPLPEGTMVIGGAHKAGELDAARAIREGMLAGSSI
jgi:2,4-dienoyl-CoA reductase (NADPH2)